MNTRREFLTQLAGIGLFSILPGAGRIWRAERKPLYPGIYEQLFLSQEVPHPLPPPPLNLQELFRDLYALKQRRELERTENEIRWIVWPPMS